MSLIGQVEIRILTVFVYTCYSRECIRRYHWWPIFLNKGPLFITLRNILELCQFRWPHPFLATPMFVLTDFSIVYSSLKVCQGTTTTITPGKKTIITLELQLYIKIIQLSSDDKICKSFLFRVGELHVVFAMSKSIGRMLENSGFDQLLTHCGIFGPATMSQIHESKHILSHFICRFIWRHVNPIPWSTSGLSKSRHCCCNSCTDGDQPWRNKRSAQNDPFMWTPEGIGYTIWPRCSKPNRTRLEGGGRKAYRNHGGSAPRI